MNDILLGFIIALGTGFLATISTIIIKKWKQWRSDDIDPNIKNNRANFSMNLFSR